MPVAHLSNGVLIAVNVIAWGVVHGGTGYLVHRLPPSALQHDGWLFRARHFEDDGRFYTDRLKIKRWKDHLPEAGALLPGGLSKRHLPPPGAGGLERFAVETRRAELGHWLAMTPAPLFVLWNPPAIAGLMIIYGVAVNLPFIAIQRYNRIRVARVLRWTTLPSRAAARSRRARGTYGNNIP